MRSISLFPFLFFILSVNGQEDFLAKQYFNDGEYKKAIVFYENLVTDNPRRTDYVENLIACYQQLERYHSADSLLQRMVGMGNPFPPFFVELGYNQTLQGKVENARLYYNRALYKIEETPNFGYSVGLRFQKYVLLDEALQAFSRAMELNPQLDYNFYMARIYGEQGNVEKMYQSYLTLVQKGKTSKSNI
ncbi:MAG: tetratricopeptide repeat protein, partial [Flavobacteriaceae bacterium]